MTWQWGEFSKLRIKKKPEISAPKQYGKGGRKKSKRKNRRNQKQRDKLKQIGRHRGFSDSHS